MSADIGMTEAGRPVSVGSQSTDISGSPVPWRTLFEQQRHFVCPHIIDPQLLSTLVARCDEAEFVHESVIGSSEIEAPPRIGLMLGLLLSRAPLLRWLEAATGCRPLVRCVGRIDRMRTGEDHRIPWHDDHEADNPMRALSIVINLSGASFGGGEFQLRRKGETHKLADFRHEQDGTAIFFDVGSGLEHRVRPVTEGGPRRVFAGWFSAADADPKAR